MNKFKINDRVTINRGEILLSHLFGYNGYIYKMKKFRGKNIYHVEFDYENAFLEYNYSRTDLRRRYGNFYGNSLELYNE